MPATYDPAKGVPAFKEELRIRLVGKTDAGVFRTIAEHGLENTLLREAYVPHAEAIRLMQSSAILLLLINQVSSNALGRVAGKVFEYMASGRPILCLGPKEGDAARILNETNSGWVIEPDDKHELKRQLRVAYDDFKSGQLRSQTTDASRYSRKALTEKLAGVLDSIS